MHFLWTPTMTFPLGLFWRMTSFPQYPRFAFILVQARGQRYHWLLSHLFAHFASHTLLSPQCCVFVSVLIQPFASSPLTYKCGHKLHTSDTHLTHYPFKDQQIITHNTTPSKRVDMMYGESNVTPLHQSFIINQSRHDLRRPICRQCDGYWLAVRDDGFECH